MAETQEVQSQEKQNDLTTDVFGKYAEKIVENRAAQKQEEPVKEPENKEIITGSVDKSENTKEVAAEAPQEPSSNGQAKHPEKEVAAPKEEIIATPEKEDTWLKDLGFEDSTSAPVVTEKADDKQILNTYKEKLEKLEKLTEDPFIAAYKAHKEAGRDVSSFIKEVRGVDVNGLSDAQLWEINLKGENLSPEDIATEMERFEALSPFEKRQKTKTVKQDLISQQNEQLKKYADATSHDAAKQAEQAKQLAIMAEQQSKQFFSKIKDKEWQGIKMTPSEVNKLENFLENDFKFQNADGSLNYELFAKVGNYALNERTILQNTYKKGETKGYEKALAEFSRANKNDQKFNSAPDVKTKNKSEEARAAAKSAFAPSTN